MLDQPLTVNSFTDALGNTCQIGDPTQPNQLIGSPILVVDNRPVIDFSQTPALGYSYATPYTDPNDPSGAQWDVRWAVITTVNGTTITSKRFIVGVRQVGGASFVLPVTLDAVVAK